MLGNCEKMAVISSTTNEWEKEWPQNQIDEKTLIMASTGNRVMEKPSQDQQQQQQQTLKCPRCDSSNTKFCYYNNYSLSQPRHFCKACKRYWTRGGTLRNVPVGGGCRRNKRVRRPATSSIDAPSTSPSTATSNPNPSVQIQPHMDISSTSNHINPLFYGIPTNHSELNFPVPRFNSRVSNVDTISGYEFQPQMNGLGLGFSSGLMVSNVHSDDYRNEFNSTKQIQDVFRTSNSVLSSFPLFGSSISAPTSTMASLIASNLQQQKIFSGGNFHGLLPYEDHMQMLGNGEGGRVMKEVKMEEGQNRFDYWNNVTNQNQIEQISSSDPSLLWNTSSVSANWLDPANVGSSVPSL